MGVGRPGRSGAHRTPSSTPRRLVVTVVSTRTCTGGPAPVRPPVIRFYVWMPTLLALQCLVSSAGRPPPPPPAVDDASSRAAAPAPPSPAPPSHRSGVGAATGGAPSLLPPPPPAAATSGGGAPDTQIRWADQRIEANYMERVTFGAVTNPYLSGCPEVT